VGEVIGSLRIISQLRPLAVGEARKPVKPCRLIEAAARLARVFKAFYPASGLRSPGHLLTYRLVLRRGQNLRQFAGLGAVDRLAVREF